MTPAPSLSTLRVNGVRVLHFPQRLSCVFMNNKENNMCVCHGQELVCGSWSSRHY